MALSMRAGERLSIRGTAKFGLLTGLCAIFIDAAIAHGLFWENDPYWTYWITKSFLIATVFIIGTAFLGIGLVQGFLITAVHTAILEIYYEWLAPIGLPQEPQWLDDNHLWVTGVPVHYLAILIGYLMALWIWRRADPVREGGSARSADSAGARATPAALAVSALVATAVILVLSGVITHAILLGEFPGITYFVQHLLIGFVFLYLWSAYVGAGERGWIVGALMLSLVWTTYGIYLGPVGLPEKVQYLTHHQHWSRVFPGDFLAALIGLFIAIRLLPSLSARVPAAALSLLALALLAPDSAVAKPRGLHAGAAASGQAHRVLGPNPVDFRSTQPANGSISIKVVEGGNRWSHVQARDAIELAAEFTASDGRYRIVVDRAMPRHPLGAYTTWNGVALNHEMHGETGIGTSKLPLMMPEISLYGWGKVWRNGQLVAAMTPVHAMVSTGGSMPGVMLEVDTEEKTLRDVAGGYLTVYWPTVEGLRMPRETLRNVQILGWVGLIGLALLFFLLARNAERRRA
ncbi:MAG TPA: hypothetical protein VFU20_06845 [Sphingomicrobium sp.]|nr:hypothetical protein [Sphingomicrobium sp.]